MVQTRQLHRLAAHYGVQTAYVDVSRRRRQASPETLLAVLAAMDVGDGTSAGVPEALEACRQPLCQGEVPPVLVAWDGHFDTAPVKFFGESAPRRAEFHLQLESGETSDWACELRERVQDEDRELFEETRTYVADVRRELPLGYHRLQVTCCGVVHEALVISAPTRSYGADELRRKGTWGVFIPAYALHSETGWGAGTLTELQALWQWTAHLGGGLVATLPLLAAFLDEPFEPSPYSPVSRLFWNDFYVDVRRAAEFHADEATRRLCESEEFQHEVAQLRQMSHVDYRRQMSVQRQVLTRMAEHCYREGGERRQALEQFVGEHAEVEDYALFRAVSRRQRSGWPEWPERMRGGQVGPEDYDEAERRYHIYAQWLAHEQIGELSARAREMGPGLYLDLPLGVHGGGYDTWRQRDQFALQASGGAPPDAVFTKGQDWGFPPLHPVALRRQGYQYLIAYLRHHLQHAGMLRIDHVMGLHRLYWVPRGMPASHGAYVRYAAEELYAILCLESHRYRSRIVGENLGTVPSYVNNSMRRHAVGQMYVVQYDANADKDPPLSTVPRGSVASVNTHDMPTFAAYWQGRDIEDLHQLELFDDADVAREEQRRSVVRRQLQRMFELSTGDASEEPDLPQVLDSLHAYLARSGAHVALINLEDLWLETQPQNIPGTGWSERPNWQRKTELTIEQITKNEGFSERLRRLTGLRSRKKLTQ